MVQSGIGEDAVVEVEAMTLDELKIEGARCLIKMDVEGSEFEVLKGSEELLHNNKVDLIVSAYHGRDDFLDLPILLGRLSSSHRLYLRLFSSSFLEMVLIAKYKWH